jgi:DNA-binding response OmpR family regulator
MLTAADGISAIAMTRKEKPDLVILDVGLPAGDGFSVLGRMKELPEVAPTIVLSPETPLTTKPGR